MSRCTWGVFLALLVSGLPIPCAAAPIDIARIDPSEMTMDGVNDEPAWASATHFSLDYEINPRRMEETSWVTRGQIFHDGASLYIWVSASDAESDRIRALQSARDQVFGNSDAITVLLDSGRSQRRAYRFTVNARATQADSISSSFGDSSSQWDGDWDSSAHLDSEGYQVELQIPFETIGATTDADGALQLGLNVTRRIGRDRNETLSLAPVNDRQSCEECQFLHAVAEEVTALGTAWRFTPYALATYSETDLDGDTTSESFLDTGLDVLWSHAGTDRVLVTLNPDFSQVEIDAIQLDINRRFPVFFSERRPFFTEDAGVYGTPLRLVDTRVISIPNFGAQYLRRSARLGAGAFAVDDELTSFILPGVETSERIRLETESTNFAAHTIWQSSEKLTLGGLLTARSGADGYANSVFGFDGNYRPTRRNEIIWQLASSTADNPEFLQTEFGVAADQSGFAGSLGHEYGGEVYRGTTSYEYYGEDFRADLGRVNQVGVAEFRHSSSLLFTGGEDAFVAEWRVTGVYSRQDAVEGGNLVETLRASSSISFRNESGASLLATSKKESFEGVEFDLTGISGEYYFSPFDRLSIYFGGGQDDAIDLDNLSKGKEQYYFGGMEFAIEPSMETSIDLSHTSFDAAQGRSFSTVFLNANLAYHFNLKHHLRGILSYGELKEVGIREGSAAYQLTYRYEPGPFTQLIAGVSGSASSDAGIGSLDPDQLFLFTKLSYTF